MFVAAILAAVLTQPQTDAIDAAAKTFLAKSHTPATSIMVVQDGQVVYSHGYGYSDVANSTPATEATHYEIGSMTKQFTAAAVVQLQEAGKLSIDDKIAKYLPDAPYGDQITIRQLLTQRTGLTDYLSIFGTGIKVADGDAAYAKIMPAVAKKPLLFAPGSKYAYSNTNYIILGKLIETVSKQPYETYIREHEWAPAGMTQTTWVANEASTPNMALGYTLDKKTVVPSEPLSDGWAWSAGAIVSTVGDFNLWSTALASGKIVSPAGYALMTTADASTADGGGGHYAFGLTVGTFEGQPMIEHDGGTIGFGTDGAYFPKQDTRIIVFTNSAFGDANALGQKIYNIMYPEYAKANLTPAAGEDVAMTARIKTFISDLSKGKIDRSQLTPAENAHMSPQHLKDVNESMAQLGSLTSFIYKGKAGDATATTYIYLLEYTQVGFLKAAFTFDAKSNKLAGIAITPP